MKRLMITVAVFVFLATGILSGPITNRTEVIGSNVVVRVGFLAKEVTQHPILAEPSWNGEGESQFYFDAGERPVSTQIIVVHPAKMKIPTDRGRKIELKGTADRISFTGGKVGESRYENEVFHLQSWRYLEDKPSQPSPAD